MTRGALAGRSAHCRRGRVPSGALGRAAPRAIPGGRDSRRGRPIRSVGLPVRRSGGTCHLRRCRPDRRLVALRAIRTQSGRGGLWVLGWRWSRGGGWVRRGALPLRAPRAAPSRRLRGRSRIGDRQMPRWLRRYRGTASAAAAVAAAARTNQLVAQWRRWRIVSLLLESDMMSPLSLVVGLSPASSSLAVPPSDFDRLSMAGPDRTMSAICCQIRLSRGRDLPDWWQRPARWLAEFCRATEPTPSASATRDRRSCSGRLSSLL